MKKRTIAILAALLLCLPLVAACGNNGATEVTTPEPAAADTSSGQEDTSAEITYFVPDELGEMNFGEETLSILYWEDRENQEYFSEGENGSEVNDAIFSRNAMVEKRMNVKLNYFGTPGDSGNAQTFLNFVKKNVNGGEEPYDVISAHSRSIGLCAYNGLTQNLYGAQYIDLSKPWWPECLTETCMINGQLHFLSGDISTNTLYMMYTVFYDKDMMSARGLEDPFNDMKAGNWTLDKMIGLCRDVYADTDSDGIKSVGDTYGLIVKTLHCDAFMYGSGVLGLETNNGTIVFSESFKGERMTNVIDKLYTLVNGNDGYINDKYKSCFAEGRALFTVERADFAIKDLNERSFTELGILPAPKYDNDQEDYLTAVGNPFSLYAIPTNTTKKDMSCAFLECMASESYRTVTPVIFEITMKLKYASGGNDAYAYDQIRAGTTYDLCRVFWKVFPTNVAPDSLFQKQLPEGTAGWAQTITSNTRSINSTIANLNKAFK